MRLMRFVWTIPAMVLLVGSSSLSHSGSSGVGLQLSSPVMAAPAQKSAAAKITRFLEQFGGPYTKASEAVWVVPFKGKALSEFNAYIATSPDSSLLVMSVTIAQKKNLKLSQPLLYRLLKYNNAADYVKVGFDDDEDLIMRADLNAKTADFQSFKEVLEQLGAASDEVYGQIKPSLNAKP